MTPIIYPTGDDRLDTVLSAARQLAFDDRAAFLEFHLKEPGQLAIVQTFLAKNADDERVKEETDSLKEDLAEAKESLVEAKNMLQAIVTAADEYNGESTIPEVVADAIEAARGLL